MPSSLCVRPSDTSPADGALASSGSTADEADGAQAPCAAPALPFCVGSPPAPAARPLAASAGVGSLPPPTNGSAAAGAALGVAALLPLSLASASPPCSRRCTCDGLAHEHLSQPVSCHM